MKNCSIVLMMVLWINVNQVSAQLNEDFEDGNFTLDPSWVGSQDLFEVLDSDSLHLADSVSGTAYLSTASTAINNASWEIYINLQFNPSASNFCRIYLAADRPNLDLDVDGYFVKVGGTRDEVSLYRQDGSGHSLIIQGAEDRVDFNQVRLTVRVTRDNYGNWELFSDVGNTGTFMHEGAASDVTYPFSAFFGIFCQYTTTRSDKIYFDQIRVEGDPFRDLAPPELTGFQVVSDQVLILEFSENLDSQSAQNSDNYLLMPQANNPDQANLVDSATVELIFPTPFGNGHQHLLLISHIQDQDSNVAPQDTVKFRYLPDIPPAYNNVVMTEIYSDPIPSQGLPLTEFVEVFNASEHVFNLDGWILADETTQGRIDSVLLFPGEYLILCPRNEVSVFSEFGLSTGVRPWPSLNNPGDRLGLISKEGIRVDQVNYHRNWHDEEKDAGGYSLEIQDPGSKCPDEFNWFSSIDALGGTPGKINSVLALEPDQRAPSVLKLEVLTHELLQITFSEAMDSLSLVHGSYLLDDFDSAEHVSVDSVNSDGVFLILNQPLDSGKNHFMKVSLLEDCRGNLFKDTTITFAIGASPQPGDLVITEIMASPSPSIGVLPEAEYLEIWNSTDKYLELAGSKIADEKDTASLSSKILNPGKYLILTSKTDLEEFDSAINATSLNKWIGLTKNSMLAMFNSTGQLIDKVEYRSTWLEERQNGGYSLELRDPLYHCEPQKNWTASISAAGGTPGTENSVMEIDFDQTAPNVQNILLPAPDQILVVFDEWLNTASLSVGNIGIDPPIPVTMLKAIALDSLLIVLESNLNPKVLYNLRIDSVMDCSGNIMAPQNLSFGIGVSPERNKLLITEIMANPSPSQGLPEVEYLEIFNNSRNLISLDGLMLNDLKDSILLPPATVAPMDYLLLSSRVLAAELNPYGNTLGLANWPELNNDQDNIQLSLAGNLIFDVNYSRTWYDDFSKENGGYSLEIIDVNNPCAGEINWAATASSVGGTPGSENSIKDIRVDHRGPSLQLVYPISDSSLVIEMDEKLNPQSIARDDFKLNPDRGEIADISIAHNRIQLDFHQSFKPGIRYEITIDNLTDCAGNLIEPSPSVHSFVIPEAAEKGDIQLSEVLYDPNTGGEDFVEVYNNSSKHIDLKGWSLSNDVQLEGPKLDSENPLELIIGPFNYKVFSTNPTTMAKEYPRFNLSAFIELDLPNFPNGEGSVVLINSQKEVWDHFRYSDDQHFALLRDTEGVSLERVSFQVATNEPGNWQSALEDFGYASPGLLNSQSHPQIHSRNVIEVVPRIFTPEKGNPNLASINYQFSNPGNIGSLYIYDIAGRIVKTIARNHFLSASGFFFWDGTNDNLHKVRTGLYLVYFEWFNLEGQTNSIKKTIIVGNR